MYINGVISFLGGWQKLQSEEGGILQEIQQVLASIQVSELYAKESREMHATSSLSGRETMTDLRCNVKAS